MKDAGAVAAGFETPPKVGRGKRNPTRWLVGRRTGKQHHEISAVGAKAAVEVFLDEETEPVVVGPIEVWPLRPGVGPLVFDAVVETVTKTTITEA